MESSQFPTYLFKQVTGEALFVTVAQPGLPVCFLTALTVFPTKKICGFLLKKFLN